MINLLLYDWYVWGAREVIYWMVSSEYSWLLLSFGEKLHVKRSFKLTTFFSRFLLDDRFVSLNYFDLNDNRLICFHYIGINQNWSIFIDFHQDNKKLNLWLNNFGKRLSRWFHFPMVINFTSRVNPKMSMILCKNLHRIFTLWRKCRRREKDNEIHFSTHHQLVITCEISPVVNGLWSELFFRSLCFIFNVFHAKSTRFTFTLADWLFLA